MPLQIALQNIPSQSFDVVLEQSRYSFKFYACFDCMAVDVSRDGVTLLSGARVCANALIIPSRYQFYGRGNFMLISNGDEIPYYDQFGVSQSLIYFTAEEMAAAYGTA